MQRYRVTGPDGAAYDITAPNDEAASAAVQQFFSNPAPAAPATASGPAAPAPVATPGTVAPPAAKPSLAETIMGYAAPVGRTIGQGAIGVRQGVSNLMGLPADLINNAPRVLNLLPGVDNVGTVNSMVGLPDDKTYMERVDNVMAGGRTAPAPQNAAERFSRRIGQEIGSATLPLGAAINVAGRVGVEGARQMNPLARMLVEPAAVNPTRFATKEMTVATGAGAGAAAANAGFGSIDEKTGTYAPGLADLFGGLGGAALTGVAGQIAKPALMTLSALGNKPKFLDDVVRETTVEEIIRAAGLRAQPGEVVDTGPFAQQIVQGRRVGETIPGFKETLADRTQNPGLAALERGRATAPGAGGGGFLQARDDNTRAVAGAMSAVEPQGTPGALRAELEVQRDAALNRSQQTLQQAQSQFDDAVRAIEPINPNAEARGATIRSGVENAERAAREVEVAAYGGFSGAVEPAPIAEAFKRVADSVPEAYRPLIAEVQDALAIPSNAAGPLDMREVVALRSRLTTAQRNAGSGPQPDSNKARVIGDFVDALDDATARGLSPEALDKWQQARAISRDVNERFNRPNDPLSAVLSRREGRPDVPDSGVGRQFIQPDRGQASNVDRVLAETDLTSRGAPTYGALQDELRADALRRGVAQKPERADAFTRDYGTAADRLGVKADIEQVGQAGRAVREATKSDEAIRRDLGSPDAPGTGTGPVGRYLRYGPENYDRALNSALNDDAPAKAVDDILNFAGNKPEAVEGARKAFWGVMQKEARSTGETTATLKGVQPWRPAALNEFINKPTNAAVMERLYRDNPEHLKRIREIADAVQGTNVSERARPRNSSGTAQELNNSNLPSAETIASRAFAYQRGQVGLPFLAINIAGVMARKATKRGQMEAINQLLDKALLDPDVALALAREYNPANRAALARKAKTWVPGQAATLIEILNDGDDPDAETKRTIMEKGQ